ncbi:adenylyltransferase/cytidyltransferase family protein [Glutamicibacter sp. PS]|uniref:adenylyltransferase/cytidyltransferase family protein n=1 Tax=Glutamicibacter sp. PS TaxID=3075634 RepID=UPI00284C683C|nr:adenylyltransferase/cytidyltransferase family protein [Glutamicibacter sp. PS]MDR4533032.1 adenylyltransferase/cytidyltransferase family protein [Glutamicibacter sp. PS]
MIIGYAAGAFDLFHIGHLNILRQARARCDFLVAGVVSDEMVEAAKGARPVIPTLERAEIVEHISLVDQVYIETSSDRLQAWRDLGYHVFFKGDDWKGTSKGRELERRFAAVGVRIEYFPYTMHTSSTQLRVALNALSQPRESIHRA